VMFEKTSRSIESILLNSQPVTDKYWQNLNKDPNCFGI